MPRNGLASHSDARLLGSGEGIDLCGWEIRGHNGPILSSPREADLANELRIRLPGMIFGDSIVSLTHAQARFSLRFDACEALRGVGPADPNIQVRAAQVWATRKGSKDFPVLENPSDWTFTTRYPGTVEMPLETPEFPRGTGTPRDGLVSIDYEVLRNTDIPILYFSDVLLFEDELDDNGTASYRVLMVRFRFITFSRLLLPAFTSSVPRSASK
jgi:type 2A phosphatase activator TIP41